MEIHYDVRRSRFTIFANSLRSCRVRIVRNVMGQKTVMPSLSILIVALFLLQPAFTTAQTAPPQPVVSPAVHPDGSVTFRVRVPYAHQVLLDLEGAKPLNMERDGSGVWSV